MRALSEVRKETRAFDLQGRVEFQGKDGIWKTADKTFRLQDGDTLRTFRNSSATIQFEDGTMIPVGPMSCFTVEKRTSKDGIWIRIREGIFRLIHVGQRAWRCATSHVVNAVRGTDYLITVSESRTRVIVLEGEVELSSIDGAKKLVVRRMEQASVTEEKFPDSATIITDDDVKKLKMKIWQGVL